MPAPYPSELVDGSCEVQARLAGPAPALVRFVHEALGLPDGYVAAVVRATLGELAADPGLYAELAELLVSEYPGDGDPGVHCPELAIDRRALAPGARRPAGLWWSGSPRPWLVAPDPARLPGELPLLFFRPAAAAGPRWAQAVSARFAELVVEVRRYILCGCPDAQLLVTPLAPHHHHAWTQRCTLHLPGALAPCSDLCADEQHFQAGQAPLRDALCAPLSELQRRHGGTFRFGRSFTYHRGVCVAEGCWYHFFEPHNGVPDPRLTRGVPLPAGLVPPQVAV